MDNSLDPIDRAARTLRAARDLLTERATALQDELDAVTKRRMTGLRNAVAVVAEADAALKAAIEQAPASLFKKPRSITLHGLQLGYRKGKGSIEWDDDAQLVKLIRRHMPDQFEVLVKVTEKPLKTPLGELAAADLKRLGVTVESTGDVVFVKDATSNVDKLVRALLKGVEEEAEVAS